MHPVSDLSAAQCLGLEPPPLVTVAGAQLRPEAAEALAPLFDAARAKGFEPAIASGYRDFHRQLAIFNGKARGQRPLLDDQSQPLDPLSLTEPDRLAAILRWSALPGFSRHHWGCDLDIYDAGICREGYQLQLTVAECEGPMAPFHTWLTQWLSAQSQWYRPYLRDLGGVAPEPWHLSFAPLARRCEQLVTEPVLRHCLASADLALKPLVLAQLPALMRRYGAVSTPC